MKPRVVIVGAGFGGLAAATCLKDAAVDVTVLDRQNHHCFQPLLYQVAAAQLSPADVAWPIRGVLRHQANAKVLLGAVTAIDPAARVVHTAELEVPYDFLVLATGSTHSYFGHDDWAAVAPGLKRIDDATTIRRRLLLAFEHAEKASDETARRRLLTFVIVGGGPTGVELAGAVSELAKNVLAADFRTFDPTQARIVLVEAGARLLPSFPDRLSAYAQRALEQAGVEVMTGTLVTGCDAKGVDLKDGRIEASTIVWAAGVIASPVAQWLNAPRDRAGRITVEADLSVPGHPEIFAVGDTAAVTAPDGKPVPGVAPAAKQMGKYVAGVIEARAAGQPLPASFAYRHQGDLATIGRGAAVVNMGFMTLKGLPAWLFWSVAHIYFLIGLRYRLLVAFKWAWDFVTFQRGVRLITGLPDSEQR